MNLFYGFVVIRVIAHLNQCNNQSLSRFLFLNNQLVSSSKNTNHSIKLKTNYLPACDELTA